MTLPISLTGSRSGGSREDGEIPQKELRRQ